MYMNQKKEMKKKYRATWLLIQLVVVMTALGCISCSRDKKGNEKVAVTFAY